VIRDPTLLKDRLGSQALIWYDTCMSGVAPFDMVRFAFAGEPADLSLYDVGSSREPLDSGEVIRTRASILIGRRREKMRC